MRSRAVPGEAVALLVLYLCVGAAYFLTAPYNVNVFDEGIILTGALRVLAGEVPSKDFYTNYGPAQFYLVAAFMELFGRSVTVGRVYDALIAAAIIPAALGVLGNRPLRWYGLCWLGLILIFVILYRSPLSPITPCIVLLLIGSRLTVRALEDKTDTRAFLWIGLVIAALTGFRYDFMLIGAAAFGTPILLLLVLEFWSGTATPSASFSRGTKAALMAGLPATLVLGALYAVGILQPALKDILTYNAGNYVEMRSLPFPGLWDIRARPLDALAVYLPPIAGIAGVATCFAVGRIASAWSSRQFLQIVALTCITLAFYTKGLVRISPPHTLISDVPAVLLTFTCFDAMESRLRLLRDRALWAGARVFVVVVTIVVPVYVQHREVVRRDVLYWHILSAPVHTDLPATGYFSTNRFQIDAARYVVSITDPHERLLSATGRHDKVFVNDSFFYFLTERLPGTRWHQYDPGVQTTAEVQRQMIEELEANGVSVIVRNSLWDDMREPNKSAESSGVTLLDDYIAENYREDRRFGPISVLRRIQ